VDGGLAALQQAGAGGDGDVAPEGHLSSPASVVDEAGQHGNESAQPMAAVAGAGGVKSRSPTGTARLRGSARTDLPHTC
jgi:hypothetical protein